MHTTFKKALQLTGILLLLWFIYTVSMLLVYTIPDSLISENVQQALAILNEEGNMPGGYSNYFLHSANSITDNLTDKEIYKGLLTGDKTIVDSAMRVDYSRYWHGYAVILRPFMIIFSIVNIRFLNMIAIMSLFVICTWQCKERFGKMITLSFSLALLMGFFIISPFCQQYVPVTLLTLLTSSVVMQKRAWNHLPSIFLVSGSLVCFFDFLTFPVLALGYPLICALLIAYVNGEKTTKLWQMTIGLSALFMLGYGLTWLAKGIIGGLLTDVDVIGDILNQATLRSTGDFTGNTSVEISALSAIKINLETFFTLMNLACFGLMLIVAIIMAFRSKSEKEPWIKSLPIIIVALWPFIWYAVLQNHTRMHFWMTYKQLSVTVFAIISGLLIVGKRNSVPEQIKQ